MRKFWLSAELWDWMWLVIIVIWSVNLGRFVGAGDWWNALVAVGWILVAAATIMRERVHRDKIGLMPPGYRVYSNPLHEEWIAFRLAKEKEGAERS